MENEIIEPEVIENQEPVVASVGTSTRATTAQVKLPEPEPEETKSADEPPVTTEEKPLELTDEQLREMFNARFPTKEEQTEEQKKAEVSALDKRMLDIFLEQGGKIEDFAKLKTFADFDLKDLSKAAIVSSLKEQGFNDDEINEVLVEQYYQINPDELEIGDEETDEEFEARKAKIAKKVAYGNKRFESKGQRVKAQAEEKFDILRSIIEERDLEAKKQLEFIAKVDNLATTLPKNITLELGKLNDKDLGSVKVDVNAADITDVQNQMKDPVTLKKLLFNEDNTINEQSIANLLLRNKLLERAAREALFIGQTRQSDVLGAVFPTRNPNALGLGAAPFSKQGAGEGEVAGFGTAQRVRANR